MVAAARLVLLAVLAVSVAARSCVRELNGQTFGQSVVVPGTKNALVEFYLPSCPHCQDFEPIYDEIGCDLNSEITVARIVATIPEVDAFSRWVPTVRYFPTGVSNSGIEYSGSRDRESVEAWVRELESTDISKLQQRYPSAFGNSGALASLFAPECKRAWLWLLPDMLFRELTAEQKQAVCMRTDHHEAGLSSQVHRKRSSHH